MVEETRWTQVVTRPPSLSRDHMCLTHRCFTQPRCWQLDYVFFVVKKPYKAFVLSGRWQVKVFFIFSAIKSRQPVLLIVCSRNRLVMVYLSGLHRLWFGSIFFIRLEGLLDANFLGRLVKRVKQCLKFLEVQLGCAIVGCNIRKYVTNSAE